MTGKLEDGLGRRLKMNLQMTCMDGKYEYNPGRMDLTLFEDGAMSLHGDLHGDESIYLYREQAEALLDALKLREKGCLKFQEE